MDTNQINKLLLSQRYVNEIFVGVFASDQLPVRLSWPFSLVVNIDPSYRAGSHWVAIHVNKFGYGEYFDSYGLKPYIKSIVDFLNRNTKHWVCNDMLMQDLFSTCCGQYCCVYLIERAKNITLFTFVNTYLQKSSKQTDDFIVKRFNYFLQFNKFVSKNQIKQSLCQQCCTNQKKNLLF